MSALIIKPIIPPLPIASSLLERRPSVNLRTNDDRAVMEKVLSSDLYQSMNIKWEDLSMETTLPISSISILHFKEWLFVNGYKVPGYKYQPVLEIVFGDHFGFDFIGYRRYSSATSLELKCGLPIFTPVRAILPGRVYSVSTVLDGANVNWFEDITMMIEHNYGPDAGQKGYHLLSRYTHIHPYYDRGQWVDKGEIIGHVAYESDLTQDRMDIAAWRVHLHMELIEASERLIDLTWQKRELYAIDPFPILFKGQNLSHARHNKGNISLVLDLSSPNIWT